MARVPESERTRNAFKDMFAGKTAADKSSSVRQAARLIVAEALESEATDVWAAATPSTGPIGAATAMAIGREE